MTSGTTTSGQTVGGLTHIPALDGLRALSICLVISAHTLPLGPKSLAMNAMAGTMGMSLFFCLSGFLIVSILHRNPDVITFLTRRVLRIVPALTAYLLILVLLLDLSWRVVALNLLFVSNYVTEGLSGGPVGHLWSLSVEMHFYMAMALLTLAFGRKAVWFIPPAAILFTLLRIDTGAYVNIKTHLRVDEILSGGTLALVTIYYGDRLRAVLAPTRRATLVLMITVILWCMASREDGGPLNYLRPYLTASVVGVVIHCQLRPLLRLLESRVAQYIARISYALYIYHMLMVWGWMNSGSDWVRYLLKRPVSFALTFAAAHISTFWWESHWQHLARRLTQHRRKISSPPAAAKSK